MELARRTKMTPMCVSNTFAIDRIVKIQPCKYILYLRRSVHDVLSRFVAVIRNRTRFAHASCITRLFRHKLYLGIGGCAAHYYTPRTNNNYQSNNN